MKSLMIAALVAGFVLTGTATAQTTAPIVTPGTVQQGPARGTSDAAQDAMRKREAKKQEDAAKKKAHEDAKAAKKKAEDDAKKKSKGDSKAAAPKKS